MIYLEVPLFATFAFMISSPSKFFGLVDEILFKEIPVETTTSSRINTANDIQNYFEDVRLEIDAKRIQNFENIIANTTNPEVKRLWEIKRTQYLKDMRWNVLQQENGASERKGSN